MPGKINGPGFHPNIGPTLSPDGLHVNGSQPQTPQRTARASQGELPGLQPRGQKRTREASEHEGGGPSPSIKRRATLPTRDVQPNAAPSTPHMLADGEHALALQALAGDAQALVLREPHEPAGEALAHTPHEPDSGTHTDARMERLIQMQSDQMIRAAEMQNRLNRADQLAKLMEAGAKAAKDLIS